MRFELLGPLSIADGEQVAVLQPSKPAILLAALLVRPNSVVSIDRLLTAIWNDAPPMTAKAALQSCVLRLRRIFAEHGIANDVIESFSGGYRITATPETLDLLRFRQRAREAAAQTDPESELYLLREALQLWRGPLLANIPSDAMHRDDVPRLTEEWLAVAERAGDIELALDRCRSAMVELWSLTRSNPGHERFWEQLIEALYRTGRRAEAMTEYRRVKTYLLTELGMDPGPGLRRLEMAILRGEVIPAPRQARSPSAAGEPTPSTTGARQRASSSRNGTPATAAMFTGRAPEIESITAHLRQPTTSARIVVICGAPGIGKTALAAHLAQQLGNRYPGGVFTVGGPEINQFLDPSSDALDPRRHRTLTVLDDVQDLDTIRPLLPTAADSAAILTSRRGLAGLSTTHSSLVHRLELFGRDESVRLLTVLLGQDRVSAEPEATSMLAETCGDLPIALRIASSRLLGRPQWRIAELVEWLDEDPLARLALPGDPHSSVATILAGALARLDPALAAQFLVLGRTANAERLFSLQECAALLGMSVPVSGIVLEQLVDHGLVEEPRPARYHLLPLHRTFARHAVAAAMAAS